MAGRYTREGDVRPLVARTDDLFVVSRPGDEVAVSFDAAALLDDPTEHAAMSAAARSLGRPGAAAAVSELILAAAAHRAPPDGGRIEAIARGAGS